MKVAHVVGCVGVAIGVLVGSAGVADAQIVRAAKRLIAPGGAAVKGSVNLPYFVPDKSGNQWMIYQGGWFRQNGNQPVYSQGAQLLIDGNNPNMNNNVGRIDADTGEIVLDMQANAVSVSRRMKVDPTNGSMRVVDVFTSNGGADQQLNVQVQTSLNFGVQTATTVNDPNDKTQPIGWAAMTQGNRAAMEWYGGLNGSAVQPDINWQQGNNVVTASYALTIPAGKSVAIVHVHQTAGNQQAASDLIEKIDPRKLLADIPKDLRRIIANVRSVMPLLGDLELLRGEALDVVELRNGDRVTGTLADSSFKLNAPFGPIDVPADRVLGAFNVGEFKPRQLIVTIDGQILGGALVKETVDLTLPGGQLTAIPLRQISRIGFRKRATEVEEIAITQPHVILREGDRIAIAPPTAPLMLATRYGPIEVPAASVASIAFQDEESAVHIVRLTDGTLISGLVTTPELDVTLASGAAVKMPVSSLAMLKLVVGESPDLNKDETPALRTLGDDALVGTLVGQLELATAFDLLKLDASGIRGLTRARGLSSDVQITTWDGATLSGQLANSDLNLQLVSGVALKVPVGLIVSYNQPRPQPSATMMEQIKTVVADLNAEDWKQRDLAESQLVSMGPSVAGVLKQLRNSQPAEVQQRIDSVLKQLEDKK